MSLLAQLQQRTQAAWLIGIDSQTLLDRAHQRWQELSQFPSDKPPVIFLAEADPTDFLAGFIAACAASCPVFLCNPYWGETEWQQVFQLVQPDLLWGTQPNFVSKLPPSNTLSCIAANQIMIPTGGSSGKIRFAIHTWETLTAAVSGFQIFFEVDQINSCCVLPLYHVSGLMQFIRSFTTGGKLAVFPFKTVDQWFTDFDPAEFFLSLVPTQLQRLLQSSTINWLAQFHTVFLGGAPAWPELLNQARLQQIRLAPTYGMTETAAQVATLKPDLFLQGIHGCGQVLPHATIKIYPVMQPALTKSELAKSELAKPELAKANSKSNLQAKSNLQGTIAIQAKSLMLGYFPQYFPGTEQPDEFQTDDLGFFDAQGILQIVGRNSQKIITGGENVFPAEVEAALLSTGFVNDVCVIGIPDQTWGEVVTAVYVPSSPEVTASALKTALIPRLSHFKHPKQWVVVKSLPRNAQGKINYEQLKQIL